MSRLYGRKTRGEYPADNRISTLFSRFSPVPQSWDLSMISSNRSTSIQSSSERAPLLSPSQRRNARNSGSFDLDDNDASSARISKRLIRVLGGLLILLVAAVGAAVIIQEYKDRKNPRWGSGRPYAPVLVHGKRGAVAAEEERCSRIGVEILKQNGSAVDAAVASTFCTGVVNMFSSGIGGGGFMIVRDPRPCSTQEHKNGMQHCSSKVVIDFRETAPSAAEERMYEGQPMKARWGGLSVGVPGELRGLEEAHRRFGRLPWKQLIAPSIALARSTYVSRELDSRLKRFGFLFAEDPDWAPTFINPDTGLLLRRGDQIKRTALATTLEAVAQQGAKAFYEGPIAESIASKVQSKGGILTVDDLSSYQALVHEAVQGTWKEYQVFTTPAPTSGPVLLSMLQILGGYKGWTRDGMKNKLSYHRLIESMKFASAQRTRLGDPPFLNQTALHVIDNISTKKTADIVRNRISDERTFDIDYYEPLYDILENHGTMHLSTLDDHGMAVALTSTVNLPFGSCVLDPVTGVILNDEMDDSSTPGVPNAFGLYPSPYNYPQPGKRPLSSTSPTIVEQANGDFYATLGGSGGSRIYGSVAQVLINLDWGLDVSAAIEHPRLHHQLLPTTVSAESTTDPSILDALRAKGHEVDVFDINSQVAEVQAIVAHAYSGKMRHIYAASDSRKGGVAAAY